MRIELDRKTEMVRRRLIKIGLIEIKVWLKIGWEDGYWIVIKL
jgi:hypothetical protein